MENDITTGEYALPSGALDELPQAATAEIFHAQRKLLAELQRLRDANERLRRGLFWQARRWGAVEEGAWEYVAAIELGFGDE
jgi:hypothetical protein